MNFELIFGLLGGLALFLYGMQMMSSGLESAAGNRMKMILERLTSNRFMGILVGAVMTTVIQSSSATTVMVVGFVNANMMKLSQAVWIIMGANIGATTTGQLVALDVGVLAPVFASIGVFMTMFSKKPAVNYYGKCLAGLGVLFIGMNMMSDAMMPLREMPEFINVLTHFSNPLIGILVGAGFTALIQSSGASVGILQALAMTGVIGLADAVYVLFGQNIGTCITSILASIGTNKRAKQTTALHLSFNLIGTVFFTLVCMFTPMTEWVASWTPGNAAQQIANMHTLFNVVTTVMLIPFGLKLVSFAEKLIPCDDQEEEVEVLTLPKNANKRLGMSAINIQQVNDEVVKMMNLAYHNVDIAFSQLLKFDKNTHEEILANEKQVNFLNKEIADYISEALSFTNLNAQISQTLSAFYLMLVDLERISDYAIVIESQAELKYQNKLNEEEIIMIKKMQIICKQMQDSVFSLPKAQDNDVYSDKMTAYWRDEQIESLKKKKVSSEVSLMISRILTSYERVVDHTLNVAEEINKVDTTYHESLVFEAI